MDMLGVKKSLDRTANAMVRSRFEKRRWKCDSVDFEI